MLGIVSCQTEIYHALSTSVTPPDAGTIAVSPAGSLVLEGASVTFTAQPKGDFIFTGWSGSISGTDNPKTVMVSSDLTIVANFSLREYPLIISVEGEGTVSERVISTKTDYSSGTVVELAAKAADHWLFDHWEGDLNGNTNPVQIAIASEKTVKAVFVPKLYDLSIEVEGEGVVSEAVVDTKTSSYQDGTTVELTAIPATGWSFDHWEGDLLGAENPYQITVSFSKSIKAVFCKNQYAYNLKIIGPGAVDEYLVEETKSSLDYGTKVLLKAFPSKDAIFKGWSGDLSCTEAEIMVDIDSQKSVVATFENQYASSFEKYPIPDLLRPSRCFQRVFPYEPFQSIAATPTHSIFADYNLDGYMDVVEFNTLHTIDDRLPIEFFLGGEGGNWVIDEKNHKRLEGAIDSRKGIYGDYNRDGYPDFCIIAGGYDGEPWPGDYPIVLLSDAASGCYQERVFTEALGFWHGGTSGDYDNDGDLDIFLICSWHAEAIMLENDGIGNFTVRRDLFNQNLRFGMYNTELYDVDEDGFLDLIIGGHDHDNYYEIGNYINMPIVLWGNGSGYNSDNYNRLPKSPIPGFGIVNDFYFYDIDKDSQNELILVRTSDEWGEPNHPVAYEGWCLQVLKRQGRDFADVTFETIGIDYCFDYYGRWMPWMEILEEDNGMFLYGQTFEGMIKRMFLIENGHFIAIQDSSNPERIEFDHGFCLYSDGIRMTEELIDPCYPDAYSGSSCIHWTVTHPWQSHVIAFPEFISIPTLPSDGYEFEFYIRCDNPDLVLIAQFGSKYQKAYGHAFETRTIADGEWHRVHVPLSDFYVLHEVDNNEWKDLDLMFIWVVSEGTEGSVFDIDEIRIRKVLPD